VQFAASSDRQLSLRYGAGPAGRATAPARCPIMLDMRVIFADVPAGLWDLPSVEMEGYAWLRSIRV
jgi:hypothetical protein